MSRPLPLAALITLLALASAATAAAQEELAPPITLQILSPLDGSTYSLGDPVEFAYTWSTEDSAGMPVITCTLDGAPGQVWGEIRTDLAPGQHIYTVAADFSGSVYSVSASFTVTQALGLAVSIVSPADGATVPYGAPVAFDYDLTYDPALGEPVVQTALDGAPGPADGELLSNLLPGPHTYTVSADQGGTPADAAVTFAVANSLGQVTGGGWLLGPPRCTFGFVAMHKGKRPVLKGSLALVDHDAKICVKSKSITGLGIVGKSAVFTGTCTINKEPGHTFTVAITEAPKLKGKAAPKPAHTFAIALDTGYAVGGVLSGGSVCVH